MTPIIEYSNTMKTTCLCTLVARYREVFSYVCTYVAGCGTCAENILKEYIAM